MPSEVEFARLVGTIEGNITPLTQSLGRARDHLGRFVSQGNKAGQQLSTGVFAPMTRAARTFGVSMEGVSAANILAGRALAAAGGVGVAALGFAAKKAVDLESAMVNIQKVTGLSGDPMERLAAGLKAIATDANLAGVSLQDVTAIAEMGGRLGIAGEGPEALLEYTRTLSMVKIAMDDIPVEEAAQRMGQVNNVFGKGVSDLLGFASAVDKMADTTSAGSRDILDVTQRISGVASVLGMTIPETVALSTAMLDVGISSEVAGTSMGNLLGLMVSASDDFARVAGMGSAAFAKLRQESPLEALKVVLAGMAQLSPDEQIAALAKLGIDGARAKTVMLQLGQTVSKLGPLVATANSEMSSHASITKSVEINSQKASAQLQSVWNSLQILASTLGATLLPALKSLASGFAEMAVDAQKSFEASERGANNWVTTFSGVVENLMAFFRHWRSVFALLEVEARENFLKIGQSILWLGDTFKAFLGWFGTNWKSIFADAFEAVTTMLVNLGKNIANLGKAAWDFVKGGFKEFKFEAVGLTKGKAAMETPAFRAPELKLGNLDDERRVIIARMEAEERARLAKRDNEGIAQAQGKGEELGRILMDAQMKATMDAAVPAAAEAGKAAAGIWSQIAMGAVGGGIAGGGQAIAKQAEQRQAEFVGLSEFARQIQVSALGQDKEKETVDLLDKQLIEQRKGNEELSGIKGAILGGLTLGA